MFAYLDPASGSMILSAVAGGAAGAAVFAKSFGNRMKFWKKGDEAADDDAAGVAEHADSPGDESSDDTVPGAVAETGS